LCIWFIIYNCSTQTHISNSIVINGTQNGHKHWTSGWFGDRAVEIPEAAIANTVVEQRLVSFVHGSDGRLQQDDAVVLKVLDWYIQYNRAKLYNVNTEEKNKVTITTALQEGALSERIASLGSGESFTKTMDDGSSNTLSVAVCETTESADDVIDYATVRFYFGNSNSGTDLCADSVIRPIDGAQQQLYPDPNKPNNDSSNTTTTNNAAVVDTVPVDQQENVADTAPIDQQENVADDTDAAPTDYGILETEKHGEQDEPLSTAMIAVIAASAIFALCLAAIVACACQRRSRKPAAAPSRFRNADDKDLVVVRKPVIDRTQTQDMSETEDASSGDSSNGSLGDGENGGIICEIPRVEL